MTDIDLPYIEHHKDRYGKIRYYFRRRGGPRTRLPDPWEPEFAAAYSAALKQPSTAKGSATDAAVPPGSFAALAKLYFASTDFARLKSSTKRPTEQIITKFISEHGCGLVKELTRSHVDIIIARKASTPAAANSLLKKLRVLIGFAIAHGWRETDPTLRIKKFKEGEFHTWTEDELAQFETRWPLGSRERTAYALHLYTGQRRGDVFRMTWADIEGNIVRVVQSKTGAKLSIPVHPRLREALDAWPKKHVTILHNSYGKAYTVGSYGHFMAITIRATGLPKRCVLHGLRKASARRLAEGGCSSKEIAAITGHKSMSEVERYTRAADQGRLAGAAILKLK